MRCNVHALEETMFDLFMGSTHEIVKVAKHFKRKKIKN